MELGITIGADYLPFKKCVEIAKLAEKLGYSQVSVPEIWGHDQISLLSVIGHETTEISISTGILNMYSRTPALAGMTAATLSELTEGRFILGLGLSGPKVIENWHGRKFRKPLQHTRDYITILRQILGNKRVNIQSETLGTLGGFKLSFKNPHPVPIHVAALGPKNMELTKEIADGWIPVIMPYSTLDAYVSKMKHDNLEITPFVLTAIGNDEKTKNLLRAHLGYYFGGMGDFYNNMLKRAGYEKEADEIKAKFMKGDVLGSYAAITDNMLDELCVYGSDDEVIERMQRFYKIGGIRPLVTAPFNLPIEQLKKTLETLAPNAV